MKVIINTCFGGFGLSAAAVRRYRELNPSAPGYYRDFDRADPALVQAVEELGAAADGPYAELKIVEISDDLPAGWHIDEYDGREHVAENHRTWS